MFFESNDRDSFLIILNAIYVHFETFCLKHQPGGPGGDSRLLRPYGNNAERSIEDFQRLVDKVHSMDDLQHSGAGKTIDAKAYRHRILQNKAHNPTAEEISLATMSPGYRREKLLMSLKNEQQEAVGTEGKATFFESLFNMANILMVRSQKSRLLFFGKRMKTHPIILYSSPFILLY